MRKYLLLIISILFTFCLVSCDKDKNKNNEKDEPKTSVIYEVAKTAGFSGDYDSWQKCLKGTEEKSPFELARDKGYRGTVDDWLNLIKGKSNDEIELSIDNGFVLWKYVNSESWNKLVSFNYLKGSIDDTMEFSTTPTHVVWKLSNGSKWIQLLKLSTLNLSNIDKNLGIRAYEIANDLGDNSEILLWYLTIITKSNNQYEVKLSNNEYLWKSIDETNWNVLFTSNDIENQEPDIIKYTVQFVNQYGEIIKHVKVEEGSYITDIPSIPGTTVNGWENNGIEWDFETDKVYDNIILRPIVNNDPNPKQYQVTFYDIYGNVINQQTIEAGSLISYVPNYSEEGYDFKGWQVNYQNWNFSQDKVNSNINLYFSCNNKTI